MDSSKCQTSAVTPAEPGDYPTDSSSVEAEAMTVWCRRVPRHESVRVTIEQGEQEAKGNRNRPGSLRVLPALSIGYPSLLAMHASLYCKSHGFIPRVGRDHER